MKLISGQAGESAIEFGEVGVAMWEWPSGCDPSGCLQEGVDTRIGQVGVGV
jgi:hypothetical protein